MVLEELKITTIEQFQKIKDFFYQKEKGAALKRSTTPRDEQEAASLGIFGPEVNVIGNVLKQMSHMMNMLSEKKCDYVINFVNDMYRSSGSNNGKRLEWSFNTLQNINPDINMGQTGNRSPPEFYGDPATYKGSREIKLPDGSSVQEMRGSR